MTPSAPTPTLLSLQELSDTIANGAIGGHLREIYGTGAVDSERQRWIDLLGAGGGVDGVDGGETPARWRLFRGPGRTEIAGNHTDHNHGRVLVGTLTADIIAAVRPRGGDRRVRIADASGVLVDIDISDLAPQASERESSAALVRGVAAGLDEAGAAPLVGFDALTATTLPIGAGLSSSAAFESLVVVILLALAAEQGAATAPPSLPLVAQAKIGQFAENTYFGKPSGLEDQLASLAGGVTAIDFKDFDNITMRSLSVDFSRHGLQMAVVDSGDSHTSLTAHYAAVATEMRDIAQHFSQPVLRNITEAQYLESIPQLRAKHGDRAVLRALHYFTENERVLQQEQALGGGDMGRFLELVSESGRSSWMLCQNCIVPGSDRGQAMALTLAMTARFIDTHGLRARSACRVHGGGFAGAIQLYLPRGGAMAQYREFITAALGGRDALLPLTVSPVGAVEIPLQG